MSNSIVADKSFAFAIRIINIYKRLIEFNKEYVLSRQLLQSGTSIGANVSEALQGQSKRDFLTKMNISLKETSETKYWLRLLVATDYITIIDFQSLYDDCIEIEKILTAIVKTTSEKIK